MSWFIANWPQIAAGVYLLVNEIIAINPNWKSNSVVQLLLSIVGIYKPKEIAKP